MRVILASGSPRRHQLLKHIVPEFEVIVSDIEEVLNSGIRDIGEQISELAEQKARAVANLHPASLVLGADTIVYLNGEILGKPKDSNDAIHILQKLSNQWHQVITGVAVLSQENNQYSVYRDHAITRVKMRELSNSELQTYVATGEPLDKAGAYAIQGGAQDFVTEIDGSYENIVGLPLELTRSLLEKFYSQTN